MSEIHHEMRPWRAHLRLCAEEDKKDYIGNNKE